MAWMVPVCDGWDDENMISREAQIEEVVLKKNISRSAGQRAGPQAGLSAFNLFSRTILYA